MFAQRRKLVVKVVVALSTVLVIVDFRHLVSVNFGERWQRKYCWFAPWRGGKGSG